MALRLGGVNGGGMRRGTMVRRVVAAAVVQRGGGGNWHWRRRQSMAAAVDLARGGNGSENGTQGPQVGLLWMRGGVVAWGRGGAGLREESRSGTTGEAARCWALAWLELGRPSGGGWDFF